MNKIAHNITDAKDAQDKAIAVDQLWGGNGFTIYAFDDNSLWVQSGPDAIAVDADEEASIRSYINFLGPDVDQDRDRILTMLRWFDKLATI